MISGALLDMVKILFTSTFMSCDYGATVNLNPDTVRRKPRVLQSLRPFTKESIKENIVRGQYTRGIVDGKN